MSALFFLRSLLSLFKVGARAAAADWAFADCKLDKGAEQQQQLAKPDEGALIAAQASSGDVTILKKEEEK